jgi:hydroxymethylbilane synthase
MLARLRGGCLAPVAALGQADRNTVKLTGRVLCPDGTQKIEARRASPAADPTTLGQELADELIAKGAAELIQQARKGGPPEGAAT